jgi:hypothetical protein
MADFVNMGIPGRYIGLASDTKPTGVEVGSIAVEYDTGREYITYDGTNWVTHKIPGLHKHLAASGQIKAGAGVLHTLTINRPSTTAGAIVTIFDSLDGTGTVIGIITMDQAVFVIPTTLVYDIAFTVGLYALFSHEAGADITISYN